MHHKIVFILLIALFLGQYGYSQQETPKDSTKNKQSVQQFLQKKKATKFIDRLIFRSPKPIIQNRKVAKINFAPYQGKIIRKILIQTLDPFGNTVRDVAANNVPKTINTAEKWGNRLHIKSNDYTIRKVLLIRENEPLDSLLAKESQRLIRSQRFVNNVGITIIDLPKTKDSVDIQIKVLDSWSLLPNGSFSGSETTLKLRERNFLGQGHEIRSEYTNRFTDGKDGYLLQYTIPSFKKTFVKLQATNQKDLQGNYGRSLEASRFFISPFMKWGGGVSYEERLRKDTLEDKSGNFAMQRFKFNTRDYWLARAFSLHNDSSEKSKITNLIIAGRFFDINYLENPLPAYDSIRFYSDKKILLLSIGINSRNFVQERYLFNNGIIEDVPIGKIYSITAGYQRKNFQSQWYLGTRASFGNYYHWGFLSMNAEWGTFFNDSKTMQSAFTFQTNYFTKLYELGHWKIRQFVKQQVVFGNNRLATTGDRITINRENGLPGFNYALYGTKKMIFSAQTQSYSPWDLWGFRMNPFFNYTLGIIGNSKKSNLKNQTYSSFGLGLIINNDYLVFSSFQLSLVYYPNTFIPNENNFKTNAFEASDLGLLDFELNKPRMVPYR